MKHREAMKPREASDFGPLLSHFGHFLALSKSFLTDLDLPLGLFGPILGSFWSFSGFWAWIWAYFGPFLGFWAWIWALLAYFGLIWAICGVLSMGLGLFEPLWALFGAFAGFYP